MPLPKDDIAWMRETVAALQLVLDDVPKEYHDAAFIGVGTKLLGDIVHRLGVIALVLEQQAPWPGEEETNDDH